jgi:octaprenyl-diphosphate synthase
MNGDGVAPAGAGVARDLAAPPRPGALSRVFQLVGDRMLLVEREFDSYLRSEIPLIQEIGSYLAESGGKRIRPALLLLAARSGDRRDDRDVLYAAVFELIHTATLVHDDIVDGADTRRGRRAVHGRWGSRVTVLLGDYLYIKSMNEALSADDLRVIQVLADITRRMIEGELIQVDCEGELDLSESRYLDIARRKTAFLFSGCCRVGAMVGGLPAAAQEALADYGLNLGMAFQITDDILDLTATEAVLGKPAASDLREGKLTLPMIYLLRDGGPDARRAVAAVVEDSGFGRVSAAEIRRQLDASGALQRARDRAGDYAARAAGCLAVLPASPARDLLVELPAFVLGRDR